MLVLSRKIDQTVVIGVDHAIAHVGDTISLAPDITITVVDIRGDKVRLGIDAPDHLFIHRGEILDKINARLSEAAQDDADQLGGKDGGL